MTSVCVSVIGLEAEALIAVKCTTYYAHSYSIYWSCTGGDGDAHSGISSERTGNAGQFPWWTELCIHARNRDLGVHFMPARDRVREKKVQRYSAGTLSRAFIPNSLVMEHSTRGLLAFEYDSSSEDWSPNI